MSAERFLGILESLASSLPELSCITPSYPMHPFYLLAWVSRKAQMGKRALDSISPHEKGNCVEMPTRDWEKQDRGNTSNIFAHGMLNIFRKYLFSNSEVYNIQENSLFRCLKVTVMAQFQECYG